MSRRAPVSQRVNADEHGPEVTRAPMGAQAPRHRHGPCIECSAPVTVKPDAHNLPLLCRECARRMLRVELLVIGAVLLFGLLAVIYYVGPQVTP